YIRCFLWFGCTHTSGGVQHSRRNVPARSRIESESLGITGDLIITFGEIYQTFPDLIFCSSRGNTEKCVWEISPVVVDLRWKIIRFRLSFLTDESCVFIVVMNMMRQRTHVVKKLGIHRPAFVFVP